MERGVSRGYFGIGIYRCKTPANVGTLWRSANILGASFIFTIGKRFPDAARVSPFSACREMRQSSDTLKTPRHIPWFNYESVDAMRAATPAADLIGIELDSRSVPLERFSHPERAIYLLGAEDHGIPPKDMDLCDAVVQLPGWHCLNVAVAGSAVLYDRSLKTTLGLRAADMKAAR